MARIVFNNDLERQWWKEIVDKLHMGDDIEETIVRFNKWAEADSPEDYIDAGKAEFWRKFFYQAFVLVDPETPEIMLEDYLITGMCEKCSKQFEGVEEGELSVEDYLRLTDERESKICLNCYEKQKAEELE